MKIRISPSTREKWARFRRMRRAWISLCLLAALFVLSLFSEWIANSTPWLVRYEGRLHFPRWQSLTQDHFLGDNVHSRPDWAWLEQQPGFAEESGNWMRWAPVRFSPDQTISPDRIELPDLILVQRNRLQRMTDLRVAADGRMRTGAGAAWFFGDDPPEFPAAVREALDKRFDNQPAPALEETDPSGRFTWELSAYEPRAAPPRTLRMVLRETLPALEAPDQFRIEDDHAARPGWWSDLPPERLDYAEAGLEQARTVPVEPFTYVDADDRQWRVRIEKETVQFPFRPVTNHPLGLDQSGRDVFTLILYATRISLLFGFILVITSMLLGTVLGGLQGYFGGRTDMVAQRLIEIYAAIPFLYAMIYLGSVFGRSFGLLLFVYAVFNWIGISYYMRAEFLRLRRQPFVEAAHSLGLPTWRVMWRHILPNALVPLITFFPFSLVGAIGSLSALDYIGFGLPVGTPSWGDLLNQAQTYRYAWWLIVYPALTLFVVILLGVFIGEGLRAAFDPKQQVQWEA